MLQGSLPTIPSMNAHTVSGPRRFLPWRRGISRGQALVEFAIILPILMLLLLLAVDFGRVFFGWVALNNATRIGANEAAKNPDAWASGTGDPGYYLKISQDLQAINCDADVNNDGVINSDDLPIPVFTEWTGDPNDHYQAGDMVTVTLHCDFAFLTPLVGGIVGNPLSIGATSTFLVFGGAIAGIPVPPDPVPAGCIGVDLTVPTMVGWTVAQARLAWTDAGFTGSFSPAPGSTDDDIVLTRTTSPAPSPGGCLVYYATVSVTHKAPDICTGTDIAVPNLSPLTVAAARSKWMSVFSGGFTPLTGSDADIVSDQATSTGAEPGECSALNTQVNVTHAAPPPPAGFCNMTQVLGFTPAEAENAYRIAPLTGFTGTFSTTPANKPSWKVKNQDLIGGQTYACSANLNVDLEQP